jgi:hypothetical protein
MFFSQPKKVLMGYNLYFVLCTQKQYLYALCIQLYLLWTLEDPIAPYSPILNC